MGEDWLLLWLWWDLVGIDKSSKVKSSAPRFRSHRRICSGLQQHGHHIGVTVECRLPLEYRQFNSNISPAPASSRSSQWLCPGGSARRRGWSEAEMKDNWRQFLAFLLWEFFSVLFMERNLYKWQVTSYSCKNDWCCPWNKKDWNCRWIKRRIRADNKWEQGDNKGEQVPTTCC